VLRAPMSALPDVSVIIATRGHRERVALFWRALRTARDQEGVRVFPIVVLNGPDVDPQLVRALEAEANLDVVRLERPSLPAALREGYGRVRTEFFTALDDDDMVLPGAFQLRVRTLLEQPELDAVVTNGYRRVDGHEELHVTDGERVRRAPEMALLSQNWLLPGSWMCRTNRVPDSLLDGIPACRETTFLALRLALETSMTFLDEPTVVWTADTPNSLSKSRSAKLGGVEAYDRLLKLNPPRPVRQHLMRERRHAMHVLAELHWREGDMARAWWWHLRSFRAHGGWRRLAFTRRLLTSRPPAP